MPAPRGTKPPNAGKGRQKGVPNKATADVRAAIALVAEQNAPKIDGWLSRIARRNPHRAMDLYLRMIEYHIPKLSRAEVAGIDGKPIEVTVVRYTPPQSVGSALVPAPPVERP